MSTDEQHRLAFDRLKIAVDSTKHITTLAAGTIVLSATLLDKVPRPITHRVFFLVAISCMFLCLVCGGALLHGISAKDYWNFNSPGLYTEKSKSKLRVIIYVEYYAFALGMASLGFFAVSNLYLVK